MTQTKVYRVREGVAWVNGARVSDDRRVSLTAAEARFDIEQGRIALDSEALPGVAAASGKRRGRKVSVLPDEIDG